MLANHVYTRGLLLPKSLKNSNFNTQNRILMKNIECSELQNNQCKIVDRLTNRYDNLRSQPKISE